MSTFGDRIKKARLESGLSQEALAKAMSQLADKKRISRTAITQWESSKTKGIEAANLLKAAKVLNIEPDWLQFGTGRMRPQLEMQQLHFDDNARFVPLLSYTQAMNAMEKNRDVLPQVGLDEQLAQVASSLSFALLIKDNSMSPLFASGDIVIVDPSIRPSPGEFVVAKIKDHDGIVFRKYRLLYMNGAHQFELIAINEDWGKIVIHNETDGEIIGTLIEHRSKRRLVDPSKMVHES
ncbi:MAG: hypothetical protein K0S27_1166 [Gammaproteobacteria bacterium]|nr:hypothetical protein [Gammaproteobacteria bacterium]